MDRKTRVTDVHAQIHIEIVYLSLLSCSNSRSTYSSVITHHLLTNQSTRHLAIDFVAGFVKQRFEGRLQCRLFVRDQPKSLFLHQRPCRLRQSHSATQVMDSQVLATLYSGDATTQASSDSSPKICFKATTDSDRPCSASKSCLDKSMEMSSAPKLCHVWVAALMR